jgi:hypothetical protein
MNYKYALLAPLSLGVFLHAQTTLPKQTIKTNGLVLYHTQQKTVTNIQDMFNKGNFFGRIRNSNFYFDYDHDDVKHESSLASAIGANFVYKSATLSHFSFTLGLYGSRAFFRQSDIHNIKLVKSSKDTFSRYKYASTGSRSLFAFGQANINYKYAQTNFTLGRQFVNTFYTKSNDTKMIPNTFDGFVIHSKDLVQTKLTLAYLAKQKLRDHETSHSVFMYDNRDLVNYSMWKANDDSAMHKGISYTNIQQAGKKTDAPLLVFDGQNTSIHNLKINFSSYIVPSFLSQVMGELNYKIALDGFSITPAIRYIQQFDNGAGAIGGASLKGNVSVANPHGYKNPDSLSAQMIAFKLVTKVQDYKLSLAYTNILNKSDLVTPWRGFPTAGYTRSMGVYNWRANTKSYRIELVKGANAKGIYKKPFIQTSILYVDTDANKGILEDSMVYYFGIVQNLPSMLNFQYRIRLGYRDFIGDASKVSNYADTRLEFNYLF